MIHYIPESMYNILSIEKDCVKSMLSNKKIFDIPLDTYVKEYNKLVELHSTEFTVKNISKLNDKKVMAKPDKKEKNTCPENRRPNEEGKCLLEGYTIIKKNKQGYDCCYKKELSLKQPKEVVQVEKRVTRASARKQLETTVTGGKKRVLKKYI